jgi:transmembrane sensor
MDDMTRSLERLGNAVANGLEESPAAADLGAARKRFLATPWPAEKANRRAIAGFAFAAVCATILGVYVHTRPSAVSFAIGAPPAPGVVGNWISAGDATTDLRFSEGTAVALAPGARVRVTETNARGAAILIEKGRLHAKVTHANNDTHWAFHAGPFQVRVTGTEFDASWDPASETFEVAMNQGSVFTTGPLLSSGRALVAGERLRVSIRDNKLEIHLADQAAQGPAETNSTPTNAVSTVLPPIESAAAVLPTAAPTNHSDAPAVVASAVQGAPTVQASAESDWRALASSGKYKDALAAAERAGFSQEVARANAPELLSLADAARLGGSPARAREALLAARTRFGVRGRTAFLIGKIAADQQGSSGEAATWFDTYLREEPGGQLAEQALGRLIEIRRKDPAAARALAERYLAKYPRGAYAALARSVLEP